MQHSPRASDNLKEINQFQLLVEAVQDHAIYMLDPNGTILTWNAGAQNLKGYKPAEIIGQNFALFFSAEDRARGMPERILREARTVGRFEAEGWRIRKDGTRFWANAVINAIRDPNGNLIGFAKVTRDITERASAQNALVESERRFRLLVEGVIDYAIYMLDPSGVIVNWNAGAQRMKGYRAEEVIGQHFSRFYTREDRTAGLPARVLETAIREGRYEAEGWRVRKDGSRFWASAVVDAIRGENGELLGFAKITRDITERRAAQEALRDSEHQLRLLIRGVTDYALYMLDPNGIVTNWNAGAARIKGYTEAEIVGQHFSRFYPEHERAAGLPARVLQICEAEGRYEADGWRVRKDGTLFWANVVLDAIRDDDGRLVGFAKITRDLTERREAQIGLQQAQAQRAHAQKMEALGQLTGGVAHDFNNLLMIVSGYMQTLRKLVGDDPKGTRAIEAIELAARRGESLTRHLLSFSRRQAHSPVVIAIGDLLDTLAPMLTSSLGPSVKLLTSVPPDTWTIRVDASEFELALINIAINARDAMPDGGIISITAENVTLQRQEGRGDLEGEFVALTIADTGCGIAPDVLPRVFDPFFTTKEASKGTGLGLSQVYGFTHQSGGTIEIESELGRSTNITLYLPRSADKPDQSKPESADDQTGSGTVLLVEDNPAVAEATAALLEQIGYKARAVTGAKPALAALASTSFDLVVSDIVMPGAMDGLSLAREIRERYPRIPIILMTGYSNPANLAGSDFAVLRKPYQLADLSRAIARVMAAAREPAPSNLIDLQRAKRAIHGRTDRS